MGSSHVPPSVSYVEWRPSQPRTSKAPEPEHAIAAFVRQQGAWPKTMSTLRKWMDHYGVACGRFDSTDYETALTTAEKLLAEDDGGDHPARSVVVGSSGFARDKRTPEGLPKRRAYRVDDDRLLADTLTYLDHLKGGHANRAHYARVAPALGLASPTSFDRHGEAGPHGCSALKTIGARTRRGRSRDLRPGDRRRRHSGSGSCAAERQDRGLPGFIGLCGIHR